MKKYFCLRFDVDTHLCLSKGVPNLVELAKRYDCQFTFLINMGRAFNPIITSRKIISRLVNKNLQSKNFSNFEKFGLVHSIKALMNPKVGSRQPQIIKEVIDLGHEIGLHGGLNHASWECYSHLWSYEKIMKEVDFGLKMLKINKVYRPQIFASPAWKSPDNIASLLEFNGFKFLADTYNSSSDIFLYKVANTNIISIPTNILGINQEVGYIENLRSHNYSHRDVIRNFSCQLKTKKRFAVLYEHPYYAGIHEVKLIKEFIEIAIDMGFKITTMSHMA